MASGQIAAMAKKKERKMHQTRNNQSKIYYSFISNALYMATLNSVFRLKRTINMPTTQFSTWRCSIFGWNVCGAVVIFISSFDGIGISSIRRECLGFEWNVCCLYSNFNRLLFATLFPSPHSIYYFVMAFQAIFFAKTTQNIKRRLYMCTKVKT